MAGESFGSYPGRIGKYPGGGGGKKKVVGMNPKAKAMPDVEQGERPDNEVVEGEVPMSSPMGGKPLAKPGRRPK